MFKEVFGVNDDHTLSGIGSGAVGRINESENTRKVGNGYKNKRYDINGNILK